MSDKLEIWTDGSYRASVGIGGIGVVVVKDGEVIDKINQRYVNTTNNQMEIRALIRALEYVSDQFDTVIVHTDSQYCLGMINNGWTATKNTDLWSQFFKEHQRVKQLCRLLMFQYTKGHDKDEYNNMADKLATDASGYTTPEKDKVSKRKLKQADTMIIALDFDGTVVKHRYPEVGEDIGAVPVLQALQKNGHQFILFTMRDNHSNHRNCLKEASDWFAKNHINLIGINCNPWQKSWTDSTKVYAPMYVDDAALGAPLKRDTPNERPYIDWGKCVDVFADMGLLSDEQASTLSAMFQSNG